MSTMNNDVFQVLVADSDSSLLAAGNMLTAGLTEGQFGVFNADNQSISASAGQNAREIYFAIGRGNKIDKSAGQGIQTNRITGYTLRNYTPSQPLIFEVSGISGKCETDYAVKLEFRNNEIYRRQGYNQFTQTYSFRTPACSNDEGTVESTVVAELLVKAVRRDDKDLVEASYVTVSALTVLDHGVSAAYAAGDVLTDADFEALKTFNAGEAAADRLDVRVRFVSKETSVNSFINSINTRFYSPRQTNIIPSLVDGFDTAEIVTIQNLIFEQGSGYDIKQKEYHASNWNGTVGPYKVNSIPGLAKEGFEYHSVLSEKYAQIVITSVYKSNSGWKEYESPITTIIAVPESNTTFITALIGLLDAVITPKGFDALADDWSAADKDETTAEEVSELDDPDEDGIA